MVGCLVDGVVYLTTIKVIMKGRCSILPRKGENSRTRISLLLGGMISLFAILVVVGCAKPPTKEMADAQAALATAKLAEADV